MVANLWHLKSPNGMFYYALEYITKFPIKPLILLRSSLRGSIRHELVGYEIKYVSLIGYLFEIGKAVFRRRLIYTPTPHPIPFYSKQVVIVHDSYPFRGSLGFIKKILIKVSAASSGCRFGYINRTDSLRFTESICKSKKRRIFLPNFFPVGCKPVDRSVNGEHRLTIGLVGTDSTKKNYERLYRGVEQKHLENKFNFLVYGNDTTYFRSLISAFPDVNMRLVYSDSTELSEFCGAIDILASVATNEGFGRPIAYAIASGVPCYLIEDEVFREFYSDYAVFASSVGILVDLMARDSSGTLGVKKEFAPPQWLLDAADVGAKAIWSLSK